MTAPVMRAALSLVIVGFIGALLWIVQGGSLDESMRDIAMIVVGVVVAKFSDVFGFYFGSSDGSKAKDAMLATRPSGEPGDPVFVEPDQ